MLVALNAQYMHVNLGLRQILCCLEGEVSLYEANINLPFRQVLEHIGRAAPDAVGFSTYIWNAGMVWRLCRALKRALPGVVLFAGGPEVSGDPAAAFASCDALDYVLSGEGEQVTGPFLAALGEGRDPAACPGVSCIRGSGLSACPPPPPMSPGDWPDVWADGRMEGLEGRILYVETSRGCPYYCRYCLSGGAGGVRALTEGEALRRLCAMAEGGAKLIKLVDRTFNYDRRRAARIWEGLIRHSTRTGTKARYHFEIGAHLLDEEAFRVLGHAPDGLFQFEAGIQSANERALALSGRAIPFEALRDPLVRLMQLGTIHLHTDLIAGLPGEDLASFGRSFDRVFAIGAPQLQLGFLKVLPGSGFRRDAGALGLVYEPDPPYEILRTSDLSFRELCLLKDVETALGWYHGSGRYPLSLKYLLETRSPFALFSDMGRRLRRMGALDSPKKEKDRADLLLQLYPLGPMPDLIAWDAFTLRGGRDLPSSIDRAEDEELRALLRQQFHPVRGQRARRCRWDVEAYARGGALEERERVIFGE